MPDDDPAAEARARLGAEAERLKARRLAEVHSEADRIVEAKASYQRDLHSVTTSALRKALSRPAFFWLGAGAMGVGAISLGMPINTSDSEALDPASARLFGLIALAIGALGVLHHYSAVARARFWLARLPFQVQGFDETLGFGMAHRRIEMTLSFKDTAATPDVLRELVEARLGAHSTVQGNTLVASDLSIESANYPAAHWFRKAVRRVLLDVHRAYPLASVHLRGFDQTEFYVGSGD